MWGEGRRRGGLRSLARDNVEFLGRVDDSELSRLYSECRALVFPQHEDYGLTPLEANASGVPVIGYGRGGIWDTTLPFSMEGKACTAVLFDEQTPDSLIQAVERSGKIAFDPEFIRRHAEQYDVPRFIRRYEDSSWGVVERAWQPQLGGNTGSRPMTYGDAQ